MYKDVEKTRCCQIKFMICFNCFMRVPKHFNFIYDHSYLIWDDVNNMVYIMTMSFDVKSDVFNLDPVDIKFFPISLHYFYFLIN